MNWRTDGIAVIRRGKSIVLPPEILAALYEGARNAAIHKMEKCPGDWPTTLEFTVKIKSTPTVGQYPGTWGVDIAVTRDDQKTMFEVGSTAAGGGGTQT